VPTSDHRVLAGGTAYVSDIGMCGDYDSVLGMAKEEPIRASSPRSPPPVFEPATGEGTLTGVAVEIDERSGRALSLSRRFGSAAVLEETSPKFWD